MRDENVHVRLAVISIHGGLDRVAHIVEPAEILVLDRSRIRMCFRCGIAVDDPYQPPVIGEHQVGIRIPLQKSRQFVQAIEHFAVDHHPAVGRQITSEHYARLALVDGGGHAHQE